jgi:hypothetical protein
MVKRAREVLLDNIFCSTPRGEVRKDGGFLAKALSEYLRGLGNSLADLTFPREEFGDSSSMLVYSIEKVLF